jgi:hypothetical protein
MMVRSSTCFPSSEMSPVSPWTAAALYLVSFPQNMYFRLLMYRFNEYIVPLVCSTKHVAQNTCASGPRAAEVSVVRCRLRAAAAWASGAAHGGQSSEHAESDAILEHETAMLCAENDAAVSHGQSLGQNSGPPGEDGGGADGAAALLAFLPVDVVFRPDLLHSTCNM